MWLQSNVCYEEKAEESNREGTVGETQGVCVILFFSAAAEKNCYCFVILNRVEADIRANGWQLESKSYTQMGEERSKQRKQHLKGPEVGACLACSRNS